MSAEEAGRFTAKYSASEPSNVKSLRIKVNSLKRTMKDLEFARKEVQQESERLNKIKGSDPDRAPQQENVLKEAQMMVPHSENRIRVSIKELSDYLENEINIPDEELLALARVTLDEARLVLQ